MYNFQYYYSYLIAFQGHYVVLTCNTIVTPTTARALTSSTRTRNMNVGGADDLASEAAKGSTIMVFV